MIFLVKDVSHSMCNISEGYDCYDYYIKPYLLCN